LKQYRGDENLKSRTSSIVVVALLLIAACQARPPAVDSPRSARYEDLVALF